MERLEELRVSLPLSKKGQLSALLRSMGQLDASRQPSGGAIANTVKRGLQTDLGTAANKPASSSNSEAQLDAETWT